MKRSLIWGLVLAALAASGSAASADPVYDTTLASPASTPVQSWYNGSGNPQGGFTVVTDYEIELGLRAKLRQSPNVIDSSNSTYTVPAGLQDATHALWNYEFSIDLRPNGVGSLTLSDIVATLTITDPNHVSISVDPLAHWTDNSGYGPTGKDQPLNPATDWGAQNSENPKFGDYPLALLSPYNPNTTGLYTFTLDVKSRQGTELASDTIQVNVVPLPASVWGGGSLLLGAMAFISGKRLLRKRTAMA